MNRMTAFAAAAFLLAFSSYAQTEDIEVAPSPGPEWTCGLTNDDLPWLADEGMRKPIAAGCRSAAGAVAVVILSDQTRLKSAMTAEQMASDAEDQVPSQWKVKSTLFDVKSVPGTARTASFSRLVGTGSGATFLSGNLPMVAVSMNEPILWADEQGAAHQIIVVFRIRSPLPKEVARRERVIASLEQTLEQWAATAKVKARNSRPLTSREYDAIRTLSTVAPAALHAGVEKTPTPADALSHAFTAALAHNAAPNDLALLEQVARDAPDTTLGTLAASLQRESLRVRYAGAQERILNDMIAANPGRTAAVLSRWIGAAAVAGDSDALALAVRAGRKHNVSFAQLQPDAATSLLRALTVEKHHLTLSPEDRDFFVLPASDLLLHARTLMDVKPVDAYATNGRGGWRLRRDAKVPPKGLLVANGTALAVLTRGEGNANVVEVSNVLTAADIAAQ